MTHTCPWSHGFGAAAALLQNNELCRGILRQAFILCDAATHAQKCRCVRTIFIDVVEGAKKLSRHPGSVIQRFLFVINSFWFYDDQTADDPSSEHDKKMSRDFSTSRLDLRMEKARFWQDEFITFFLIFYVKVCAEHIFRDESAAQQQNWAKEKKASRHHVLIPFFM